MSGRGGPNRRRASSRRADWHPPPADPGDPRRDPEPDPHDVARQIVLRQLTAGARSRAQLAAKLRQRGCSDEVAAAVLDRMVEVGLVDDAAYARFLVASRHDGKGLARRALAHEMRAKGVAPELGDQALATVSDEQERDRARALVEKRLRSLHGLPAQVQARRLAGLLARKGYPGDVAYGVIQDALRDAPEHLPD